MHRNNSDGRPRELPSVATTDSQAFGPCGDRPTRRAVTVTNRPRRITVRSLVFYNCGRVSDHDRPTDRQTADRRARTEKKMYRKKRYPCTAAVINRAVYNCSISNLPKKMYLLRFLFALLTTMIAVLGFFFLHEKSFTFLRHSSSVADICRRLTNLTSS